MYIYTYYAKKSTILGILVHGFEKKLVYYRQAIFQIKKKIRFYDS